MSGHSPLTQAPADLIAGQWIALPGDSLCSTSPAHPENVVWQGSPVFSHVDQAIAAARNALPAWAAFSREKRFAVLRRFQEICKARQADMAGLICDETGKAMWESKAEASLLASKVDITLDESEHAGLRRVSGYEFSLNETKSGRCWFRPHGVIAVLGPFNFPAHLPNGHIIPALAMGNTIIFKPSDKTPAVGQLLAEFLHEALEGQGAPSGVVNAIQGAADIASSLVTHDGIDGILFTGSWPVGRKILEANLDRPGRIIALELGGNNPAVVLPDADLRQAAIEIVRCAFNTTGQRCTCTRRVIIHEAIAHKLIPALCKTASNLIVGDPRADHPVFMGPIITDEARQAVLSFQAQAARAGAEILLESTAMDGDGWFLTPGIMKVDRFSAEDDQRPGCDSEVFGPLLRLTLVSSLDQAIEQANATRYGLAASIFTHDQAAIERFMAESRAGCVNINTGTAGASSKLPFGGLGFSGNQRPAGAFSLDYCAYPVAGMIESGEEASLPEGMRFEDAWL